MVSVQSLVNTDLVFKGQYIVSAQEKGCPGGKACMRIAVDAMGGDYAPVEIVRGAEEAVRSCR